MVYGICASVYIHVRTYEREILDSEYRWREILKKHCNPLVPFM